MPAWARIFDVDSRILRTTLESNTLGALRMCQAFVPLIMEAGCGRVVNVSSSLGQINGMTDEKMVPAYPLSNAALIAVTLMVADAAPPPQPPLGFGQGSFSHRLPLCSPREEAIYLFLAALKSFL
jgi:NAD(P)-dependent dehydrogenase (short-subunit alcohol dehydrogenase family)